MQKSMCKILRKLVLLCKRELVKLEEERSRRRNNETCLLRSIMKMMGEF